MKTNEFDFKGIKISGFLMLFVHLLVCVGIWLTIAYLQDFIGLMVGLLIFIFLFLCIAPVGFMTNEPNNARVMIFFGRYCGTLKNNGFFWVNPFYVKKRITLRARNLDAPPIKVNDKSGNPIMIGMVLVWKVIDTCKAVFDIDTSSLAVEHNIQGVQVGTTTLNMGKLMRAFEKFVKIQSDAALREVAGHYAYDNNELQHEETTLRSGGEMVNSHLVRELNERLAMAGIVGGLKKPGEQIFFFYGLGAELGVDAR